MLTSDYLDTLEDSYFHRPSAIKEMNTSDFGLSNLVIIEPEMIFTFFLFIIIFFFSFAVLKDESKHQFRYSKENRSQKKKYLNYYLPYSNNH